LKADLERYGDGEMFIVVTSNEQ